MGAAHRLMPIVDVTDWPGAVALLIVGIVIGLVLARRGFRS